MIALRLTEAPPVTHLTCPKCGVKVGVYHRHDCPDLPDDLREWVKGLEQSLAEGRRILSEG